MTAKKKPSLIPKSPKKKPTAKPATKTTVAKKRGKYDKAEPAKSKGDTYKEKWSMHPGETLRKKRGISAKEQQALCG